MARYRGTVQGARGQASRLGSPRTGLAVTANGWSVGVQADIMPCSCGQDIVVILRTSGSLGETASRTVARYHAGTACERFPDING